MAVLSPVALLQMGVSHRRFLRQLLRGELGESAVDFRVNEFTGISSDGGENGDSRVNEVGPALNEKPVEARPDRRSSRINALMRPGNVPGVS